MPGFEGLATENDLYFGAFFVIMHLSRIDTRRCDPSGASGTFEGAGDSDSPVLFNGASSCPAPGLWMEKF